jgi:hypothetical protein
VPFIGIDTFTLITTIFWLWMLLDCIFNSRLRGGSKIGWFMLIFFTHWIGALIYFFTAAEHKNPVETLTCYLQQLHRFLQQNPAPLQRPSPPRPQQEASSLYQQGYQAQDSLSAPGPANTEPAQPAEPPLYQAQPEYEQPTATYPEMPMQEQ